MLRTVKAVGGLLGLAAVLGFAACSCARSRPLREAIVGEWEIVCRTDSEATATCLGREQTILRKTFRADGTMVSSAVGGTSMEGTWALDGQALVIEHAGGDLAIREDYRARIEDEKLVLWYVTGGFGAVYARRGAEVAFESSEETSGEPVTRPIGGVRYRLSIPSGYRLARDDNQRQRWDPISGDGLTYSLSLTPRSREIVDGRERDIPCEPEQRPLAVSTSGTPDQTHSVGTSICIATSNQSLACNGGHTRGHLRADEIPTATAVCRTLTLAR